MTVNKSRACMGFGGWFNVKETTACSRFRREGEEPRDSGWSMEGKGRSGRCVGLFLVFLLLVPLFPAVQAQSGSVVFDEASFSIDDYTSFEGENLPFSVEVDELNGFASNASLHLLVETLEGIVLSNTSQTLAEFQAYEVRNISGVFTGLPVGFSKVSVSLEGDIGTNTSTHQSVLSRTVQRLRPLAITFGGVSSVLANPLDDSGQSTGNLSLHDGDRLEVSLPVINNGDVNWTGAVELHLDNGQDNETVVLDNLLVAGSTSQLVTLSPVMVVAEGPLDWTVLLTNTSNSEPGVHDLNGSWSVGPPPLPLLDGFIASNAGEVQAGAVLSTTVSVWNNGSVPFTGSIVCTADGSEVFDTASILLEPSSNSTWSFSIPAKPQAIVCDASDARVSDASTTPFELVVNMPSAVFESAGATTPSFSGGPWHKGDSIQANLLLRNIGDLDGRVRLVLSTASATSEGDWVEMDQGAAGEVSATFQFLDVGATSLTWMLESDNGVFSGQDNGSTTFVIKQQQSVLVSFVEVNRTEDAELAVGVLLELDAGNEREVRLQVGYESGGSTVYLFENDLLLQPGQRELNMVFGELKADRLVAQIAPINWLIGPGPLATTTSLPTDQTQFWLEFSPTTTPIRPVGGDEATVRVKFQQSGPLLDAPGELWLMDAYGARLAKVASPTWNGGSTTELDVAVTWPTGSSVAIQALWHVDGAVVSAETTYVSGEEVVETSTDWPVGAMLWGVALGAGIALVLRLRNRKTQVGSTKPSPKSNEGPTTPNATDKKQEKREVACPECNRRLRVPVDYNGSVGCPDCSHKFTVEPEQNSQAAEESDDLDIEVQPVVEAPLDEKVQIACPDCSQTLRIPSAYRGSVRCPACTKIFKAYEGDV